MWSFKQKLLSSTFVLCCLAFLSIYQMKFVIVQAWLHKEVDKWQAADGKLFSFNVFVPVSLDLTLYSPCEMCPLSVDSRTKMSLASFPLRFIVMVFTITRQLHPTHTNNFLRIRTCIYVLDFQVDSRHVWELLDFTANKHIRPRWWCGITALIQIQSYDHWYNARVKADLGEK